jgi:starch synthase
MVNTVSPSYMREIQEMPNSLAYLFKGESHKCIGILNGIDNESWDPKTDPLIRFHKGRSWDEFKQKNKEAFAEEYGLDPNLPWFAFIGRFSEQKGVDTIPLAIQYLLQSNRKACFIILGNGSKGLEYQIRSLEQPGVVKTLIMYNESIAHQIYAASDFMLMPSRFEPCGLNQMFSMRYGTVPVVRATGGLIDTVVESPENGTGFLHLHATPGDLSFAMVRALEAYANKTEFKKLRGRCVKKNFSWEKSAETYATEYKKLI